MECLKIFNKQSNDSRLNENFSKESCLNMINEFRTSFDGNVDSNKELIESFFNFIDEEIEIRIESLKITFDLIGEQKLEELANYEMNAIKKSNKNLIKRRKERIFNSFMSDIKSFKMRQPDLESLARKTNIRMNNFEFNTNHRLILINQVGFLFRLRVLSIDILRKNSGPVQTKLLKTTKSQNSRCHSLKSLCSLFDKFILFAHYKANQILVYNSEFLHEASYEYIHDAKLDKPNSICTNDAHTIIYLVNFGRQELILVDKSLDSYRKRITRDDYGCDFFPVDCAFFRQNVYLLERGMCRIIKLNENGDFQNEYPLFQSNDKNDLLRWPLNIQINSNVMAILDDWKFIYIYDLNAHLKQIISDKSTYLSTTNKIDLPYESDIQSFIIVDNYLIFHSKNGILSVYIEKKGIFKFLFNRQISKLVGERSHLCVFNGQLIFAFDENNDTKHIVVI